MTHGIYMTHDLYMTTRIVVIIMMKDTIMTLDMNTVIVRLITQPKKEAILKNIIPGEWKGEPSVVTRESQKCRSHAIYLSTMG
eukprot:CAMPEP_0194384390 /NCGR_PEP_ID=MMETSP0174-20130528/73749_1 /TAXON_ID=216777 /ORGANISM="Proboscia alata, Strain PI-D3" /LENGTH=82 /DNA_ID=CAMNT_0039171551 /DNA_START=110 /DNA_END=355 /DNA_ORIENTATION=-